MSPISPCAVLQDWPCPRQKSQRLRNSEPTPQNSPATPPSNPATRNCQRRFVGAIAHPSTVGRQAISTAIHDNQTDAIIVVLNTSRRLIFLFVSVWRFCSVQESEARPKRIAFVSAANQMERLGVSSDRKCNRRSFDSASLRSR